MTLEPFPENEARDRIRQIIQAVVDVAPGGGGVNRVADVLFAAKVQKRRDDWFRRIGVALAELLQRADDLDAAVDALASDDRLVTAVMVATDIAGRTHEEEKLEALRNACLHTATDKDLDDQYVYVFLRLIDDLSTLHLKVLTYLSDPIGYFEMHNIERPHFIAAARRQAFEQAMPAVAADKQITDLVLRDLEARGLNKGGDLTGIVSENAVYDTMATDLGLEFLAFIAPPWPRVDEQH